MKFDKIIDKIGPFGLFMLGIVIITMVVGILYEINHLLGIIVFLGFGIIIIGKLIIDGIKEFINVIFR